MILSVQRLFDTKIFFLPSSFFFQVSGDIGLEFPVRDIQNVKVMTGSIWTQSFDLSHPILDL